MKTDSRALVVALLIVGIIISTAIGTTAVVEFGDEILGKAMMGVTLTLACILGHKTKDR